MNRKINISTEVKSLDHVKSLLNWLLENLCNFKIICKVSYGTPKWLIKAWVPVEKREEYEFLINKLSKEFKVLGA